MTVSGETLKVRGQAGNDGALTGFMGWRLSAAAVPTRSPGMKTGTIEPKTDTTGAKTDTAGTKADTVGAKADTTGTKTDTIIAKTFTIL